MEEEDMEGYRKLTVVSIEEGRSFESVFIKFEESIVELQVSKEFLREKGLDCIHIGQKVWIKGRSGNNDGDLWGVDRILDILPE